MFLPFFSITTKAVRVATYELSADSVPNLLKSEIREQLQHMQTKLAEMYRGEKKKKVPTIPSNISCICAFYRLYFITVLHVTLIRHKLV